MRITGHAPNITAPELNPSKLKARWVVNAPPSLARQNPKLWPSVSVIRVIRVPVRVTSIRVGIPVVGIHVHVRIPVGIHVHVRVHVGIGGCRVGGICRRCRRGGVDISSARVGIGSRRPTSIGIIGIYLRRLTTSCPERCNSKQGKKS